MPAGAAQRRRQPRPARRRGRPHPAGLTAAKVAGALAGLDLVDVAQAAMRQRMIKSAEEIELIKHGARIGDLGGDAIRAAITEGVPEYEVALAGTQAMVREIARTFPDAELRDTWVWFQSGINTDGAHNWATTPQGAARRHPVAELLPDDRRLLHGAGAHPVLRASPSPEHLRLWRSTSRSTSRGLRADQARRRVQGHRRRAERDLRRRGPARQPHVRLRALLRRAVATTTAAKPAWNCARTSTPCSSPAWSSPWSR